MADDASPPPPAPEPAPVVPPAEPAPEFPPPAELVPTPSIEPEAVAPEAPPEAATQTESAAAAVPEGAGEPPVEAPHPPATASASQTSVNDTRLHRGWSADDRKAATTKRVHKKEAHLEEIIKHVREHKRITNDEIVHKLHVSDATAARYTKILIGRGALKMEGKGRTAVYVLPA